MSHRPVRLIVDPGNREIDIRFGIALMGKTDVYFCSGGDSMTWKMEKHINVLAILFIAYNSMTLLAGLIVLGFFLLGGALIQEPDIASLVVLAGMSVAALLLVLSIPGLIAGYGLMRYKNWSRLLTMILAIIHAFNVPLGTALAVYALWVLTQDEAIRILEKTP